MQTLSLRSILNYRGSIIKLNSTNYTTCPRSTAEVNFLTQKLSKINSKIKKKFSKNLKNRYWIIIIHRK